ncbi:MAG: hypothetical protein HOG49_03035 [Candidatus Scalindua sp.]|jgi:hypothetical protein|nr:hypothetical protein [Candidatus Scalindua sp.]
MRIILLFSLFLSLLTTTLHAEEDKITSGSKAYQFAGKILSSVKGTDLTDLKKINNVSDITSGDSYVTSSFKVSEEIRTTLKHEDSTVPLSTSLKKFIGMLLQSAISLIVIISPFLKLVGLFLVGLAVKKILLDSPPPDKLFGHLGKGVVYFVLGVILFIGAEDILVSYYNHLVDLKFNISSILIEVLSSIFILTQMFGFLVVSYSIFLVFIKTHQTTDDAIRGYKGGVAGILLIAYIPVLNWLTG